MKGPSHPFLFSIPLLFQRVYWQRVGSEVKEWRAERVAACVQIVALPKLQPLWLPITDPFLSFRHTTACIPTLEWNPVTCLALVVEMWTTVLMSFLGRSLREPVCGMLVLFPFTDDVALAEDLPAWVPGWGCCVTANLQRMAGGWAGHLVSTTEILEMFSSMHVLAYNVSLGDFG